MNSTDTDRLHDLARRLERLDAAQAVRNTLGCYMQLCDVPCGDCGALGLADLFSQDSVWEGIGPLYAGKFGRHQGPAAIAAFVGSYLAPSPHFTRNLHFLTSEQLEVDADCRRAHGRWLMLQLSTYGAGGAEAITARLEIDFIPGPDGRWLIAHLRTERLECVPWHDGAAREVAP